MENLGKRLLYIGESQGLTRQDFAARLGVSAGVLSHISSGRNNPGLEIILSALTCFQDVNPEWLLFGKGEMKREQGGLNEKIELIKLLLEIKLMNEMNYNTIKEKIETLESKLKGT